jgi:hypothetical protein
MTAAVLLDHVSAYAAAVRAHLADLSPEQVDDLTDGLEADLAEALEDREGPVVTGEIPVGRSIGTPRGPDDAGASTVIDLTRRFGPAAEYAAELRAAAGLEAVGPAREPRVPLRTRVLAPARDLIATWRAALAPFLATPPGQALTGFLGSLRPLWWVLRGWVWYVISGSFFGVWAIERFVPLIPTTWLWLAVLVALSISVGRGLGEGHRVWRKVIVAASVVALLWVPWATTEFRREVEYRLAAAGTDVQYVENTVTERVIEDGVFVDGMAVSNLFVYDADGEPLTGVQIFDDRGRAVQTTFDDGWNEWFLPGVDEPWHFMASRDADGRDRWNVYPLTGAPVSSWESGEDGELHLLPEVSPRIPPSPFAKAPSVVVPGLAVLGSGGAGDGRPDSGGEAPRTP